MSVVGISKVRNEAHIIKDTLDNWAEYCDLGIYVYCDNPTDETPAICRGHRAVREVVVSNLLDPDRERAEWFNRHTILHSARRFIAPGDWIAYFDGDEHIGEFDPAILADPQYLMIALRGYEAYITEEDKDVPLEQYWRRQWVGPEYEYSPYFYRNVLPWDFRFPDQRNMDVGRQLPQGSWILTGRVIHWGKALSVEKFEEKVTYYSQVFGPKYAEKWANRKGKAVHDKSDFGQPLVKWQDVLAGKVPDLWRRTLELVQ